VAVGIEIGDRNRRRGVRPASFGEMLRMIREYRKMASKHPH